jgi:iron-sulfur cluster assembly accessory protein
MKPDNIITKDTLISAILAEHPERAQVLADILTEFGIHCVGCGAAGHETLQQGVLGHGYSKKELDALLDQLNQAIESPAPQQETPDDFGLTLTPAAADKVRRVMQENGRTNGILRVEVLEGGCSGFKYELHVLDQPDTNDWCGEQDGIRLAVAQAGLDKISGMEIDYVDTLNEAGFKFNNPKASHGCGCGKSFR